MYIIIGEVPMAEKVQSVYDRQNGDELILVNTETQNKNKLCIVTGRVFHNIYPEKKKIYCCHYLTSYTKKEDGKFDLSREEVKISIRPL